MMRDLLSKGMQKNTDKEFRLLVKEHGDRVFNLALMKSNQVTLAEDITQETFIRVYKGLHSFRNEAQIGTWIYRIALNVCHTLLMKESRISMPLESFDENDEIGISDDSGDVQKLFQTDSEKYQIRKAIAGLPPKQADAITLYYLREFKYTEVAEIMAIPVNTVKSHLRRAKENLRQILKEVEL
jgi:RNA polymerase sigma-70 factor, ECF subfamily